MSSLKFPHTVYSSRLYSFIKLDTLVISSSLLTLISILIGILGNASNTSFNKGNLLSSSFSVPIYSTSVKLQFLNHFIQKYNFLKNCLSIPGSKSIGRRGFNRGRSL